MVSVFQYSSLVNPGYSNFPLFPFPLPYWTKVQYARLPLSTRLISAQWEWTTHFGSQRCGVKGFVTNNSKPLIAIVDDDESVCRAIKRLVRSLGMEADTFTSGSEFIELLEAMPFAHVDCVILDVQMAGLNGLEVQERLAHSGHPLPVIFITAYDEVGVCERALAAGAVAFLRKPFNDDLLIKSLNEALKRSGWS